MKAYPVKAMLVFALGAALAGCAGEGPDEAAATPESAGDAGGAADAGTGAADPGPSMAEVRAGNWQDGYHFVQVSTHGIPRWSAYVDEISPDWSTVINSHGIGAQSGGKQNFWYWTWGGTHYHVHIWSLGHAVDWYYSDTTVDHCFQVDEWGSIHDKGTSAGGGCNSH